MEEGEETRGSCILGGLGREPKQPPQDEHVFKVAGFFLEMHVNFSFSYTPAFILTNLLTH